MLREKVRPDIMDDPFLVVDSDESDTGSKAPAKLTYSRKQLTTLIILGFANIFSGTIYALQAPFYPKEAEEKGATATEYGLVLGIFQLVMFIMSIVCGYVLGFVNPRIVFHLGITLTAISALFFGFLDYVPDHVTFISLSFVLRILQACGDAGFVTASFTLIAMEFPDSVATTFATFETCFGIGLVIGPGLGGALYELGGFILPFLFMGTCLMTVSILTHFLLPDVGRASNNDVVEINNLGRNKTGVFQMLTIPVVALAYFSLFISSCSTGFLTATLEPHLRENFGLSPGLTGLMFILDGSMYALSAPVWGRLVDKSKQAKVFTLIGAMLTFTGFLFIGPAPFIPLPTLLWLTIIGLIIHGLGQGASCVSAFLQALKGSVENGFPDNVATYGVVSGLWMSSFSLGAFVGPSIGGILLDNFGFKLSSIFVFVTQLIIIVLTLMFIYVPNKFISNIFPSKSKGRNVTKSESETAGLLQNEDLMEGASLGKGKKRSNPQKDALEYQNLRKSSITKSSDYGAI